MNKKPWLTLQKRLRRFIKNYLQAVTIIRTLNVASKAFLEKINI